MWSDERWQVARRCGAKHMSKSKCTEHTMLGPFFGSWDVDKVYAVVARGTFRSQKCRSDGFGALLDVQMSFFRGRRRRLCTLSKVRKKRESPVAVSATTTTTLHSTPLQRQLQLQAQLHYNNYIALHDTPLHYTTLTTTTTTTTTTLHSSTLRYLHSTTLHFFTFHYTNYIP